MNVEFRRIARRDKKSFSDPCKEIEENNRIGKTRHLFNKIRDIKGTAHAKMGKIKDRNCMDLTEAVEIKKRWQEYTEELYKKDLHELLIAKFRLTLKKVGKTTRPFRYNLNQIPYDYTVEVKNRFKGLDLIHKVTEELWMEVHDIVQEVVIKTIPKKKK